jgi:hypothetical protein
MIIIMSAINYSVAYRNVAFDINSGHSERTRTTAHRAKRPRMHIIRSHKRSKLHVVYIRETIWILILFLLLLQIIVVLHWGCKAEKFPTLSLPHLRRPIPLCSDRRTAGEPRAIYWQNDATLSSRTSDVFNRAVDLRCRYVTSSPEFCALRYVVMRTACARNWHSSYFI